MPYTKTNWVDKTPTNSGTPVNADNLNKIEEGIEDVTLHAEQNEASIKDLRQNTANAIIGTASGETVTLTDVQEGTNARSLVVTGEDIEEVHLTVHGKNLWQNDGSLPKTTGGVTVSYDSESGEYILHGTSSSAALNIYIMPTSSPVLTFRKDTQVTLKITRVSGTNRGNISAAIAKSDFTGGVGAILSSSGGTAQNTATVTTGTQINRMYFYIDASGTVLNNLRLKVQLEIGSTPTAFEPFRGYAEYQKTFDPPLNGSYDITTEQDIPLYSPTTIISTDQGSLEAKHNRDINTALSESGLDPAMFVPRVNTANRVYTTSATGQQETKPISDFATPSDITNAKKSLKYTIAAPNAIEPFRSRADLILNTTSPHTQLANAVEMLHTARGGNTDIPIVIEFVGGEITFPNYTNWEIPEEKGNIYIYGNGVKINGNCDNKYLFRVVDCWLFDLEVENGGIGNGIHATNSTLTNCSGIGHYYGIYADDSTLTNCSGSSDGYGGRGIYAYSSILTNCSGSGGNQGIYANGSCIIQGCDGTEGGISVPSTGTYPQTLELLQQLNKGSITIRS